MRLVPTNPALRMPGALQIQRQAMLMGGVTGALVGSAIWALARNKIGWYGVIIPIAGAGAGMVSWAAFERQAMR